MTFSVGAIIRELSSKTKSQLHSPISLQLNQSKEEVEMIKMYQRKAQDIKKSSIKYSQFHNRP